MISNKFDVVIDLRDGGDWSLDLCFAGLVKNLGYENVIDHPYKAKHREWGIGENSWGKERRTLGYTSQNTKIIAHGSMPSYAKRVWLDERMESFVRYKEYGLDKTDAKVVVVAGHDRFQNHSPKFVADLYGSKLAGMLLDNWYQEYWQLPFKAKRIGWSCNFDHYWERPKVPPEKDIDISFIGYNSHPDRLRYIEHIKKRWPELKLHLILETTPDTFSSFIPKSEYFNIIQRSKICLNLRGAADRGKTMRFYEIPYVGSFMLSQAIDDPGVYEDFRPSCDCEYFHDEDELDDMIAYFCASNCVAGNEEREMLAESGHHRATIDLSVKQRWLDVLKWLDNG